VNITVLCENFLSALSVFCVDLFDNFVRLELKNPDKFIRLASERTGLEGKVDADSWFQAFSLATLTTRDVKSSPVKLISDNVRSSSKLPVSMIRKMSMSAFNIAGEEKPSMVALFTYGSVIVLLIAALCYCWIRGIFTAKTFVTLSLLMFILIFIFVQEFLFDDANDSTQIQPQSKTTTANTETRGKDIVYDKPTQGYSDNDKRGRTWSSDSQDNDDDVDPHSFGTDHLLSDNDSSTEENDDSN
jgi:hypothetical protein